MLRSSAFRCFSGFLVLCAVSAGCDGPPTEPSDLVVNTAVSPNAGSMLGATQVVITGYGFRDGVTVVFGDLPAVVKAVSNTKLTVESPAHAEGPVRIVVTNPNGSRRVLAASYTYEIDPPFTISGIVTELTAAGEIPVEGVQLEEDGTRTSVQTDSLGAYRLAGLRRSKFDLWLRKPGYEPMTTAMTASSDKRVDLRIDRIPSFVLSGTVFESTPAGRVPLADVVLYCDGCGSPVGHTFVTTDANGLYSFEWTRNGLNWIQFISKDGYRYAGPLDPGGIRVNVSGNTKFDIELVKR